MCRSSFCANWKLGKTEQALELFERITFPGFSRWNPYAICGELSIHRGAFEGKLSESMKIFFFGITRMGKEWEMRCDQLKRGGVSAGL